MPKSSKPPVPISKCGIFGMRFGLMFGTFGVRFATFGI
jgi:hypothetical protein